MKGKKTITIKNLSISELGIKALIAELREKGDDTTIISKRVLVNHVFGGIVSTPVIFFDLFEKRQYECRILKMTSNGQREIICDWSLKLPKMVKTEEWDCLLNASNYGIEVKIDLQNAPENIDRLEVFISKSNDLDNLNDQPDGTISGSIGKWLWRAKPRQRSYFFVRARDVNEYVTSLHAIGLGVVKTPTKRSDLGRKKPSKTKIKGKMEKA